MSIFWFLFKLRDIQFYISSQTAVNGFIFARPKCPLGPINGSQPL